MSIFLINPFLYIDQTIRQIFTSGYQAARTTTTSTTMQTKATANTTETAGDYAAFWQISMDNSSTTSDVRSQLFETSIRQLSNIEPQDATDLMATGGAYAYTGGTNKTFTAQYSTESGTAGAAGTEVNILKLTSKDKWAHNSGTTNATANAVSITITEPGDYLVIGSGMLGAGDSAELFDGTTSYGAVGLSMNQDATSFSPFWHVRRFNGLTNQTLSVRVTLGTIRTSTIIALNLSNFKNVYYAEQPTQQSTTGTAVTAAFSQTFTIANPSNLHLVIGAGQLNVNSTANSGGAYLRNLTNGANYNATHNRENNATTEYYPTPVIRLVTFSATSNQFEWVFFTEVSGTATRLRNMAIAVLDLGTT